MKALIYEDDEERFYLSPKGCLFSAMRDMGIVRVEDILSDDEYTNEEKARFNAAFEVLEYRFNENGFITDENGETHPSDKKPIDIFKKTIGSYYRDLNEDVLDTLYDAFCMLLERHQGALKEKNEKNNE